MGKVVRLPPKPPLLPQFSQDKGVLTPYPHPMACQHLQLSYRGLSRPGTLLPKS